ncbi:MAG: 50S ribosomal protein L22 [Planctomycetota bacterium]|jgi:large subunit ribosomal protein L22
MLNNEKFKKICEQQKVNNEQLAEHLVRSGLDKKKAIAALKNWQKGQMKPIPRKEDISRLATALSVNVNDLVAWRSSYRYAPMSASKARLVTQLIVDRPVQDAMDILKFTKKRAASMINKVLKCAVADADEQQADVDNLFVCRAYVEDAGVRAGTKRWIPKDRGRAHPIRKKASHIYITVAEAK